MPLYDYEQQNRGVERRWNPYGGAAVVDVDQNAFIHRVYQHMALGLGVTGAVALFVAQHKEAIRFAAHFQLGLIIVELGLVFGLSLFINKMSALAATTMFYLYALVTGVTLSILFEIYTHASIANTFFVTAGTFGAVSLFGYFTKRDLTGLGHFMFMGLIGIIIASIVNFFVHSSMIAMVTTYIGVLVFVGLTAYDTQKLKRMAYVDTDGEGRSKLAILGALALYLDFLNLFLELLQLTGDRK